MSARPADLPARFTIERKSKPLTAARFLSTNNDGGRYWGTLIDVFVDQDAAEAFRDNRMGKHASDAVVVRHTVH